MQRHPRVFWFRSARWLLGLLVVGAVSAAGCAGRQAQPVAEAPAPVPQAFEAASRALATEIGRADARQHAWERLAYLCDTFGPRFSGSQALEDAIDWTIETMTRDGLSNVRRQPVQVPKWVRGPERARLLGPVEGELVLLGLGGTVATPKGGITAEVVAVGSLAELAKMGPAVTGKIVLINQPMPAYNPITRSAGYGETVRIRVHGPSAAARLGAKAVLIRSVTARSLRTPHTGALVYAEDAPRIPAAALAPSDAEMLARMTRRGPVKVALDLQSQDMGHAESANVIAELRGRERPEEIVVIGGHIDSWDVGQGAHDDGAGVLMAMEAAYLLESLELIPRRTIRVVLFTNEENGTAGAKAYFAEHHRERHVAAMEADTGGGAPHGFRIGKSEADLAPFLPLRRLFAPFGAENLRPGAGGADIKPLIEAGVLGIDIDNDISHYFDFHHTDPDTVDQVDPEHLQKNAAAMALMAYILAERD